MTKRTHRPKTDAKALILKKAAMLFRSRGMGVTIEEIASEAGYSSSALYKHFGNRDAIMSAMWARVYAELLAVLENAPPIELGFRGRMRWLFVQTAELAQREWEMFALAIPYRPAAALLAHIDPELAALQQRANRVRTAMIADGIEEGVLRQGDPDFFARMFYGMINEQAVWWASRDHAPTVEDMERVLEFFLEGASS